MSALNLASLPLDTIVVILGKLDISDILQIRLVCHSLLDATIANSSAIWGPDGESAFWRRLIDDAYKLAERRAKILFTLPCRTHLVCGDTVAIGRKVNGKIGFPQTDHMRLVWVPMLNLMVPGKYVYNHNVTNITSRITWSLDDIKIYSRIATFKIIPVTHTAADDYLYFSADADYSIALWVSALNRIRISAEYILPSNLAAQLAPDVLLSQLFKRDIKKNSLPPGMCLIGRKGRGYMREIQPDEGSDQDVIIYDGAYWSPFPRNKYAILYMCRQV